MKKPAPKVLDDDQLDRMKAAELRAEYKQLRELLAASEQRVARITAKLAELRESGKYTGGGAPFGFKLGEDDTTLEPNDGEQRAIKMARALRRKGYSLRRIAAELEGAELLARKGVRFEPMQVKRMLERSES